MVMMTNMSLIFGYGSVWCNSLRLGSFFISTGLWKCNWVFEVFYIDAHQYIWLIISFGRIIHKCNIINSNGLYWKMLGRLCITATCYCSLFW